MLDLSLSLSLFNPQVLPQLIGYLTVFVTFLIQPLMRYVSRRISGILKLIICDIYYLMTFFGAVNAWRGIWNLLDVYVYPGKA